MESRPPLTIAENAPGKRLALVLGGGGARAAYQVGFLRALARLCPHQAIPVVTGISAGAINAAFLAGSSAPLPESVARLTQLWHGITVDQVFRADLPALLHNVARWGLRLMGGGSVFAPRTRGLMDTAPLREFLTHALSAGPDGRLHNIEENLRTGRLHAAGITTTDYSIEQSITWVQGRGWTPWRRPDRRSETAELTVEHIMASCALPLFFPAVRIGHHWHGDGGIRLTAPLSPALHLGSDRVIAITTRHLRTHPENDEPARYPPPASVIGVLLNAVFLDMFDYDEQNLKRLNVLAADPTNGTAQHVRNVDLLVVRPSVDLGALAAEFEHELPRSFRFLTRGLGTREAKSADLLATLLFQPGYIRRVMEIGEQDGLARRDEILAFLHAPRPESLADLPGAVVSPL